MSEATLDSPQEAPGGPLSDEETSGEEKGQEEDSEASETYEEVFDRAYVQGLRDQNSKMRVRSKKVDDLAAALVTAYVSETGRLHDPSDLPYSDDLLDDGMPDKQRVSDAVEKLVTAKPHLAKLLVRGDVGQGVQGQSDGMQSLGSMLKRAAG